MFVASCLNLIHQLETYFSFSSSHVIFCSTSLPLASSKWAWSTFYSHCPLNIINLRSLDNFSSDIFGGSWVQKQVCYPLCCAAHLAFVLTCCWVNSANATLKVPLNLLIGSFTPPRDWSLSAKDILVQTPRAQVVESPDCVIYWKYLWKTNNYVSKHH